MNLLKTKGRKKMTNYEKIKEMSIDEMAALFERDCDFCVCFHEPGNCSLSCEKGVKKWLESEAEAKGND